MTCVEYSIAFPKGAVICELCSRKVPWPSYVAHVEECWRTPPADERATRERP